MVKRALLGPAIAAPLALLGVSTASPLFAQGDDDKKPAPEQRAESFEAAQGAVVEDVPGGPLMVAGYAILWMALLAYLFRLIRLQQRAQNDLARLERALARDTGSK